MNPCFLPAGRWVLLRAGSAVGGPWEACRVHACRVCVVHCVFQIDPNSIAARDGRIREGDRIIQVGRPRGSASACHSRANVL